METFLTFIFITVLVVYLAAQLGKWLLRRWIIRKQREIAEQFSAGAGAFDPYGQVRRRGTGRGSAARREGEIKVQRTKREEKKVSGKVGEYVDFEEVKE